jgi:DNA-binding LacI/PurR family transcriptional regulator
LSGEANGGKRRRPRPVTVAEVADAAGVSRQTVSNVLHAPQKVLPKTRKRVEAAIARLGYQPNRAAQALRVSASRMLGYRIEAVRSDVVAAIHDRFLHALADAGRASDHHVLLFTAADAEQEVTACARLFRSGAVDGVVLYDLARDDPRPAELLALDVPFVAFGRTETGPAGFTWVDVDDEAGVAAAVDHLVEHGHRRIGHVGWPEPSAVGGRRARGWHSALERHGLLGEAGGLDLRAEDTVAAGVRLGGELLDRPQPPTAIVAATDTLAVGVLQAAHGRGLAVGRDLAVVGFDDTPTAVALELSSVRQPIEEAGRAIVEALLAIISDGPDGERAPRGLLLAPRLVARASSGGAHLPPRG